MNPCLVRTSLPTRLTVEAAYTRISLSLAIKSLEVRFRRMDPIIWISTKLKHLYFEDVLLGCIQMEFFLQFRRMGSACSSSSSSILVCRFVASVDQLLRVVPYPRTIRGTSCVASVCQVVS